MSELFKKSPTFRLFRREPSAIEGISRLFDLQAKIRSHYNDSQTENDADFEALKSDWKAVGNDLKESIREYEQKLAKSAA